MAWHRVGFGKINNRLSIPLDITFSLALSLSERYLFVGWNGSDEPTFRMLVNRYPLKLRVHDKRFGEHYDIGLGPRVKQIFQQILLIWISVSEAPPDEVKPKKYQSYDAATYKTDEEKKEEVMSYLY